LLADPGLMPVQLDTSGGVVPAYPQATIDTLTEAASGGVNEDRLRVLVGSIGLPMSTKEAADAVFRGIIEKSDFYRSILEGDVRPEWADAIFAQAAEIITAHDAVENTLRGYTDTTTMYAQTARHGMSEADTTTLYQNAGRPLNVHAITTGLARGGTFQPEPGELTDPYEASVHESNIKPAYYDLAIANKYTIPGYFVIEALVKAGSLAPADAGTYFLQSGWPPDLVTKVVASLSTGTSTSTPKIVTSATTAAVTAVRKAYLAGQLDAAGATQELTGLGETPAAIAGFLAAADTQKRVESLPAATPAV
jgi:hypothetical protein